MLCSLPDVARRAFLSARGRRIGATIGRGNLQPFHPVTLRAVPRFRRPLCLLSALALVCGLAVEMTAATAGMTARTTAPLPSTPAESQAATIGNSVPSPSASSEQAPRDPCTIRAAVFDFPPYAFLDSAGVWRGEAVDLFRATARDIGCDIEFIGLSQPEFLQALEREEVDAIAMALTPNPLTKSVLRLTPSFGTSHVAIAVFRDDLSGDLQVLARSLTTPRQLRVYAAMASLVLLFALLIWVLEHSKNQHFRGKRHEGIGSGLWWSITTLSTVGYGDKVPVSALGRFFAGTWMVFSLILVAIFTATVTSSITTHDISIQVNGPHDLPRARVGVVENGLAASYVEDHFLPHVSYPHLSPAIDDLRRGDLDAVLADKHSLEKEIAAQSDSRLTLLSTPVSKSPISFGFRKTFSSDVIRRFDAALIARLKREAGTGTPASGVSTSSSEQSTAETTPHDSTSN